MKKFLAIVVLFAAQLMSTQASAQKAGPFGFYRGETPDEALTSLPKGTLTDVTIDTVTASSAPKPFTGFRAYVLIFSPETGLVKVVAIGEVMDVNAGGDQLRAEFARVEKALLSVYGSTPNRWDFLKTNAEFTDPQAWMMSLFKKERILDTMWTNDAVTLPNHIVGIDLESRHTAQLI